MRTICSIALLLSVGCYAPPEGPDPLGADDAIEIVLDTYGAGGLEVHVEWIWPVDDYPSGVAWEEGGICHSRVEWDGEPFFETALAHELLHCVLNTWYDLGHEHPWWSSKLPEAIDVLRAWEE